MKVNSLLVGRAFMIFALLVLAGSEIYLIATMDRDSDLSSSEQGWTGASEFKEQLEQRGYEVVPILTTPSLLYEESSPDDTLFMSIGPEREYSLTEMHSIRKFYSNGGKVLLADDTGNGDQLASRFDVNFIRGQLYDQNFEFNPNLVKFNVKTSFFEGFILMNKPSSLTFASGQALLASTTSAWVDRNGNGINDNISTNQGEAQGIRYLAVISDPDFIGDGSGTAVFISDPSIFMNGMIDQEQNLDFTLSLVRYLLPDGGKIILDDSVHGPEGREGFVQKGLLGLGMLTTDVNLKIVVGSLIVLSMLAVGYLYEPPRRPKHETILSRTGVAELIEPELLQSDLDELKKAVLERIRISYGMSVTDFAALSWEDLREIVGNDDLFNFIRKGKFKGGTEKLLLEVMEWHQRK